MSAGARPVAFNWQPYLKVVAKKAGQALVDWFHIATHMSEAIDIVAPSDLE